MRTFGSLLEKVSGGGFMIAIQARAAGERDDIELELQPSAWWKKTEILVCLTRITLGSSVNCSHKFS